MGLIYERSPCPHLTLSPLSSSPLLLLFLFQLLLPCLTACSVFHRVRISLGLGAPSQEQHKTGSPTSPAPPIPLQRTHPPQQPPRREEGLRGEVRAQPDSPEEEPEAEAPPILSHDSPAPPCPPPSSLRSTFLQGLLLGSSRRRTLGVHTGLRGKQRILRGR